MSGGTAAPMRCSAPPAAARRRCSTSSPACCAPTRGRGAVRRPRRHRAADRAAQHRAGVPVPGRLRHDDGAREPRLPACATAACRARESRRASSEIAGLLELERDARPPRPRPHRRRQAEDLARPRPGARRRRRDPVRRAADRHRPAAEMGAALAAQGAAPPARPHDDLRHARPDRGADLRRHGRGDARRGGGADGHAGGAVRAAGAYLRRLLHRLARHELAARPRSRARGAVSDGEAHRARRALSRAAGPARRDRHPARIRRACGAASRPAGRACGAIEDLGRRRIARRRAGGQRDRRDRRRRASPLPARGRARASIPRGMSTSMPDGRLRPREACADGQAAQQPRLVPGAAGAGDRGVLGRHPADDGGELFGAGHLREQPVLLERHRLVPGAAGPLDRSRRALLRRAVAQSAVLGAHPADRDAARHRGRAVACRAKGWGVAALPRR